MAASTLGASLAPSGSASGAPGPRGERRCKGSLAPSEFLGPGLPASTHPCKGAVRGLISPPWTARKTRAGLQQNLCATPEQGCQEGGDHRVWGFGLSETPAGTGRRGDLAVAKGLGLGVLGPACARLRPTVVSKASQGEHRGHWAGAGEGLGLGMRGSGPHARGFGLFCSPSGYSKEGRGDLGVARGARRGTSAARMVGGGSVNQLAWPRRPGGKMDSKSESQLRWEGLISDLLSADLGQHHQQRQQGQGGGEGEGAYRLEAGEGGEGTQKERPGPGSGAGAGAGGGGRGSGSGGVLRHKKKKSVWKRVVPSVDEVLTSALQQGWLTRQDVTGALVRCSQLKRFSCILQILDWARSPSGGAEWWGPLSSQDHCMRITALARSQGVEAAKQAFREMEDSLEPVNAIACTALLEGLCRAQDMGEADKLLARMEVQGPAPTAVTYQTYLHGLSKAGAVDEMERALACLERGEPVCARPQAPWGQPPSTQSARGVSGASSGAPGAGSTSTAPQGGSPGGVPEAGAGAGGSPVGRSSRRWEDMNAREVQEQKEDAALRAKLYGGGAAQAPSDFYSGMRRPGEVVQGEGEEGEEEGEGEGEGEGRSGRESQGASGGDGVGVTAGSTGGASAPWMRPGGAVSLDVGMFNLLLHTYSQAGRFEDATRAFRRMKALGVVPTRSTYNILIAMFARDCRSKECEGVLRQMQAAGVRPDVYTYTSLLTSYGRAGRAEEAQAVFRDMVMCKILPSAKSYTALVDAYSRAGDVDKAERVFKEMTKRYPFHVPGYTAMVGSYCREGMMEQAENLLRRLIFMASGKSREGPIVTLTPPVFNTVMGGYRQALDLDAVIATFERMLAAEVEPDVGSFHVLIKAYAECGDFDGAVFAFKEMVEVAGLKPDGAIKRALLDACHVGSDSQEAGEGVGRAEGGGEGIEVVNVAQRIREVEELMREFVDGDEGVLMEEGYGDEDLELVGMAA